MALEFPVELIEGIFSEPATRRVFFTLRPYKPKENRTKKH